MAILSGVMLVIFFAKLDDVISKQYQKIFEVSCHNQIIIIGDISDECHGPLVLTPFVCLHTVGGC